jgi:hypothetical protein
VEQGTSTRIPPVLRALHRVSESLDVGELQRLVGGFGGRDPERRFLVFGLGWENRPEGVQQRISQESSGLVLKPVETLTIRSVFSTLGGESILERLDDAAAVLSELDLAIRADPKLGGVVDTAWYGDDADWYSGDTADGAVVTVCFEIVTQAWL